MFLKFLALILISTSAHATRTFDDNVTVNGKLKVVSNQFGSVPCPSMTQTERDASFSSENGSCIFNTTTKTLNVYDASSSTWKSAGGGVSKWATATLYQADDVVIQSNKFYIALMQHLSGTFATDLAGGNWQQLQPVTTSDITGIMPLNKGGTNKNMTAVNGGVVYTDADSQEVSAAGTSGHFLKSNGTSAPSFSQVDIASSSVTGVLPVANGGTGANTLTANSVLVGSGTSAITGVAPGTSGNLLRSNGTSWTSATVAALSNGVSTIGSTTVDIQAVYFGSGASCTSICTTGTCTICGQVGNKITSITWDSVGAYRLNGLDGTKYMCWGAGFNGSAPGWLPFFHDRNGSTSTYARVGGGTTTTTNGSYITVACIGIP